MANKKISELEQAQQVSSSDLLPIVQNINGVLQTNKVTVGEILATCDGGGGSGQTSITLGGFAESFPLPIAAGRYAVQPGCYGFRFTPGQSFVARQAQICQGNNMSSGTFNVAIYSEGSRAASGSGIVNAQLLAQTGTHVFGGTHGVNTVEFPANEQITLDADKEYYMVLFVQHTSSRELICRRMQTEQNYGGQNFELGFIGSQQIATSTLDPNAMSQRFPMSNLDGMPYIKIYGDAKSSADNNPVLSVLEVKNSLIGDNYSFDAATGSLTVPFGTQFIVWSYTGYWPTIKNIVIPNVENGYKISIGLNRLDLVGEASNIDGRINKRFQEYLSDKPGGYMSVGFGSDNLSFLEFIYWNGVWYSKYY